jgi:hypothetical protein
VSGPDGRNVRSAIRRATKSWSTTVPLIRCYQTNESSPYRGLRQSTSRVYGDWCRTLDRAIGRRRVDHLTGWDVRDCFLRLMEPTTPGGVPRVRLAKACAREMLSILLPYGAEVGLPGCLELNAVARFDALDSRSHLTCNIVWETGEH